MKTLEDLWKKAGLPRFRRGINLGDFLEAPVEGRQTGGLVIQDEWFPLLAAAGFDFIRLPARWSAHAAEKPPYGIEQSFLARVVHLVDRALDAGMTIIVNQHHYLELTREPAAHADRFVALWKTIAAAFRGYPDGLVFELLNEPTHELTAARWNELWPRAYATVRAAGANRVLIVGSDDWNNVTGLPRLSLAAYKNDARLMGTFHYYEPHVFTHQGAAWVDPPHPLGAAWHGTPEETAAVERDFDLALDWAEREQRVLFLGEFGAYQKILPRDQVTAWISCVRAAAEKRGIPWCFWEFCHGFGAWDRVKKEWKEDILRVLIP